VREHEDRGMRVNATFENACPYHRLMLGDSACAMCRDDFEDVRSAPDTAVSVEMNGGFTGACIMLAARQWGALCEGRPGLLDRVGANLRHDIW
jgi:hypothetical protein